MASLVGWGHEPFEKVMNPDSLPFLADSKESQSVRTKQVRGWRESCMLYLFCPIQATSIDQPRPRLARERAEGEAEAARRRQDILTPKTS